MDLREVLVPRNGVVERYRLEMLMAAIEALLNAGVVRQVYKVVDPVSQVPVGQEFESPLNLPDRVLGRFDEWVETSEADVVPLLREA